MDEANESRPRDFQESMVTQALAAYLGEPGKEDRQRMTWLFALQAETPDGSRSITDMCKFEWAAERVSGGHEVSFKEDDKGKLPLEEFKKKYWTITPDFRYWTKDPTKQLIIEAKGTPKPIGRRERDQAERYFMYLLESGFGGAVVYFAPNPQEWLKLLTEKSGKSGIPFGVVDLKDKIIPEVHNELVRVVAMALVQTADLLGQALSFSKTT
jgi:hypothetical protein